MFAKLRASGADNADAGAQQHHHQQQQPDGTLSGSLLGGSISGISGIEGEEEEEEDMFGVGLFGADPAAMAEEELRLEREAQLAQEAAATADSQGYKTIQSKSHVEPVEVYCVCRQPDIPGVFMVQCEQCDEWFHGPCVGLQDKKMADIIDDYICASCDSQANEELTSMVVRKWQQQQQAAAARSRSAAATASEINTPKPKPQSASASASGPTSTSAIESASLLDTGKTSVTSTVALKRKTTEKGKDSTGKKSSVTSRKPSKSSARKVARGTRHQNAEGLPMCARDGCTRPIATRTRSKYCSPNCGLAVARDLLCLRRLYAAARTERDLSAQQAHDANNKELWIELVQAASEITRQPVPGNETKPAVQQQANALAVAEEARHSVTQELNSGIAAGKHADEIALVAKAAQQALGIEGGYATKDPLPDCNSLADWRDRTALSESYAHITALEQELTRVEQNQHFLESVFEKLPSLKPVEESDITRQAPGDMFLDCVLCRRRQPAFQLQRHMDLCYKKHTQLAGALKISELHDQDPRIIACGCPLLSSYEMGDVSIDTEADVPEPELCSRSRAACLQHVHWEDVRLAYHAQQQRVIEAELRIARENTTQVQIRVLRRLVGRKRVHDEELLVAEGDIVVDV